MMNRREMLKGLSAVAAMSAVRSRPLRGGEGRFHVSGRQARLITGTLNPLPQVAGKDPIDVIIENLPGGAVPPTSSWSTSAARCRRRSSRAAASARRRIRRRRNT